MTSEQIDPHDSMDVDKRLQEVFEEQSALVRTTTNPIIQFVLGTAPYTGGVGSLLSASAQKRQERRLRSFLLDFAHYVETHWSELESELDKRFVSSDEFAVVLEDSLTEAGRSADERKLHFLRSYIVNAARKVRPDTNWRDLFRTYLAQLSGTHLLCLQYAYSVQKHVDESDRFGSVRTDRVPISVEAFTKASTSIESSLARLCFADLSNAGLLVDWRALGNPGPFQKEYCITRNGFEFMRFIEGEWRNLG
jgi:hypothetical protein